MYDYFKYPAHMTIVNHRPQFTGNQWFETVITLCITIPQPFGVMNHPPSTAELLFCSSNGATSGRSGCSFRGTAPGVPAAFRSACPGLQQDGGPYQFVVRPGDAQKLLISFQGVK